MNGKNLKRNLILGILFFLPVTFLILLYPAKHNYQPLDIVKSNLNDIQDIKTLEGETLELQDHLTVLAFLGNDPMSHVMEASNVKELVYDKFKGFKKFQIIMLFPESAELKASELYKEITTYEDMRFFHMGFGSEDQIKHIFLDLKTDVILDESLFCSNIFIIDRELNQRGRIDDRDDKEIENQADVYPLYDYSMLEVAEMKNKMSEDMRVLFTEYRQKRKGKFDSTTRRADDLKESHE